MKPIERIMERVRRNGDPNKLETPRPLLTIDEFFDGNEVVGSIGCNLEAMPTPAQFREALEALLRRPQVADVRVQITMFDDPAWPFSDTVWVMTSASADRVRSWLPEELEPDDVWEGWQEGQSYEAYDVPEGMRPVACFWD